VYALELDEYLFLYIHGKYIQLTLSSVPDVKPTMSSPAKRRKKNDFQPSAQPVRSLDYFFNKLKSDLPLKTVGDTGSQETPSGARSQPVEDDTSTDKALTDEQLARKLQDEWNNEDSAVKGDSPDGEAVISASHGNSESKERNITSAVPTIKEVAVTGEPESSVKEAAKPETLSLQSVAAVQETVVASIPFDENPLTFDPSKYLPDLVKLWAADGGETSYSLLIRCFILVNSTQSRIKIVDTLVNLLRTMIEGDPDSLLPAVSSSLQLLTGNLLKTDRFGSRRTQYLRHTYHLN